MTQLSNLNVVIEQFRSFLNQNLDNVNEMLEPDIVNDWIQANWEILVESKLCVCADQFLAVYGDGADCNESSSRVWNPSSMPTHQLVCSFTEDAVDQLSKKPVDNILGFNKYLEFESFCSWDNTSNQYAFDTPLEYAICNFNDDLLIVGIEKIKFDIKPLMDSSSASGN